MPTAAVGRMKQEQRQLGRKEAQTELEAKAKAAGFSSVDEMITAAQASKSGGGQRQPGGNGNGGNGQRNGNGNRDRGNGQQAQPQNGNRRVDHKTQQNVDRERRQRIVAERKAKEAQSERDAESARFSLERSAWGKGIRDTDYAITLLTRHVENLSDEELGKFDEGTYFDGLRKTHAYLFGETVVPATTGVGGAGAPTPPPADQAQRSGAAGQKPVREMNKQEYEAHLRKSGYTPPSMT